MKPKQKEERSFRDIVGNERLFRRKQKTRTGIKRYNEEKRNSLWIKRRIGKKKPSYSPEIKLGRVMMVMVMMVMMGGVVRG